MKKQKKEKDISEPGQAFKVNIRYTLEGVDNYPANIIIEFFKLFDQLKGIAEILIIEEVDYCPF